MIPFEEALKIVLENGPSPQAERVQPDRVLGRVLAEDIISDIDMPPFDKAAVDGFACRREDLDTELEILETIPAGKLPEKKIIPGTASRIMTGSVVPEGADCVFMVEYSVITPEEKVRYTGEKTSSNICRKGEDIRKGDQILEKGTRLEPQHIACLAAVGAAEPLVYKQPSVGVLSTGNELVEPDVIPSGASIRNSNAHQLIAQIRKAGAVADYGGIAEDTEASLEKLITRMTENNDVVLLTGGVSMGDFDHVPSVLEKLGYKTLIRSIAIQPGKPTVFATKGNKFIFGLPGNPVSSFVLFEMLVKPFLNRLSGDNSIPLVLSLPAGKDISRKKTERLGIIPVRIINGEIFPIEYHGSAHINAYAQAQGMAMMKQGVKEIRKGEKTDVRPL